MFDRPHAIFCLWEIVRDLLVKNDQGHYNNSNGKLWRLVETYGVDKDGYALGETQHASSDRRSYSEWMSRKYWHDKEEKKSYTLPEGIDEEDHGREEIPGRVTTGWSIGSGISLIAFNPPGDTPWLNVDFLEVLKKSDRWAQFIKDGHTLYLGTAFAAEKLLWPIIPPKQKIKKRKQCQPKPKQND